MNIFIDMFISILQMESESVNVKTDKEYWKYFDLSREDVREIILGVEYMEYEEAFDNIRAAMPPTVRYKKTYPGGGYFEGYDARVKRFFWQLNDSATKLTEDIENDLEGLWCCYHYFKNRHMVNDRDEVIGTVDTNRFIYLRKFLKAQVNHGWLFDCEFTMSNPHPYKPPYS